MPKVYNRHHPECPKDAVYIGRPTKWGNPFQIGPNGSRQSVISKYRQWLKDKMTTGELDPKELAGKDLSCWCKPAACHGDILLELANG